MWIPPIWFMRGWIARLGSVWAAVYRPANHDQALFPSETGPPDRPARQVNHGDFRNLQVVRPIRRLRAAPRGFGREPGADRAGRVQPLGGRRPRPARPRRRAAGRRAAKAGLERPFVAQPARGGENPGPCGGRAAVSRPDGGGQGHVGSSRHDPAASVDAARDHY